MGLGCFSALNGTVKLRKTREWLQLALSAKKKMHILASNFSAKQHKLKVREGVIFFSSLLI